MIAKQTGGKAAAKPNKMFSGTINICHVAEGDAASGTYIGFYDCHVAPAVDWYKVGRSWFVAIISLSRIESSPV